ncbi:MAG: hypothetical protein QOI80_1134 [Solirubrobacteraceae bacterium]|jgi:hypothetical protein|nr:hypothetical protein [Solirubrobacteraceae bacterium]
MRKLILLALGGAAAAYVIKSRGQQGAPSAAPAGGGYAPGPESAAEAPATDEIQPTAADEHAEEVAAAEATPEEAAVADTVESDAIDPGARFGQTEHAPTGEGLVPDTSDDDPLVRQQEEAAAADAATIGGDPDTVTEDVEPEMRPVVEGSGDAEETFEQTEDEGR